MIGRVDEFEAELEFSLGPIVGEIAPEFRSLDDDEQVEFLRIGMGAHGFSPFRVVRLDAVSGQGIDLPSRVEEHVRAVLPKAVIDASNVDPWLEEVGGGAYVVSTAVAQACEALSDRTNEIAPRFVTRDYRILVKPLAPHLWHASGERVRVSLARDSSEDGFDLRIAGSGVATWATLAVEAMRPVSIA